MSFENLDSSESGFVVVPSFRQATCKLGSDGVLVVSFVSKDVAPPSLHFCFECSFSLPSVSSSFLFFGSKESRTICFFLDFLETEVDKDKFSLEIVLLVEVGVKRGDEMEGVNGVEGVVMTLAFSAFVALREVLKVTGFEMKVCRSNISREASFGAQRAT